MITWLRVTIFLLAMVNADRASELHLPELSIALDVLGIYMVYKVATDLIDNQ